MGITGKHFSFFLFHFVIVYLQKALVSAYGNVYGSTYDMLDSEKIRTKAAALRPRDVTASKTSEWFIPELDPVPTPISIV